MQTDLERLQAEISRLMAALEDVNFECQRLEIGDEQGRAVQNLFATCENVQVRQDIYGKDRILIATVA